MTPSYRYFLSVTSQVPFCGIPFRLDSYSTCQFSCKYCFAADRGGAFGASRIAEAQPNSLRRRLERISRRPPVSVLDEMLAARVPIHFGGMSDPFMPMERKRGVTLRLLETLAEYRYPTVISTKGTLAAEPKYLDVLANGNFAVQYSFSSLNKKAALVLEAGVPNPSERLEALSSLADAGVPTAIRLQPYLPLHLGDAYHLVHRAAEAGAKHFAVEHLKLPVENDAVRRQKLNQVAGYDLGAYYKKHLAQRVGREWMLPPIKRLATVDKLAALVRSRGMSFGAADSDFLHFSDGNVCCSGADLLGLGRGMEFNFLTAVRKGMVTGRVTFQAIAQAWRPTGSISKFINSNSRSPGVTTVESYIRDRWNGVSNGPSPNSFFGVMPTEEYDGEGYRIYSYTRS